MDYQGRFPLDPDRPTGSRADGSQESYHPLSVQLVCLGAPPADLLARFSAIAFAPASSWRHEPLEALLEDLDAVGGDALVLQVDHDGSRMLVLHDGDAEETIYRRGQAGLPLLMPMWAEEASGEQASVSLLEDRIALLLSEGLSYSMQEQAVMSVAA